MEVSRIEELLDRDEERMEAVEMNENVPALRKKLAEQYDVALEDVEFVGVLDTTEGGYIVLRITTGDSKQYVLVKDIDEAVLEKVNREELSFKLELRAKVYLSGNIRLSAYLRSSDYSFAASDEWLLTKEEFFGEVETVKCAWELVKEFVEEHRNKLAERIELKQKVKLELDRLAEHIGSTAVEVTAEWE